LSKALFIEVMNKRNSSMPPDSLAYNNKRVSRESGTISEDVDTDFSEK
jgi:hypothetical protein